VGAGLVKIVTHKDNRELIYSKLPEAMISTYEVEKDIDNLSLETDILWADAVLIGPGLSTSITAKRLLEKTLNICRQYNKYLVIDADGLNIMSADDNLLNMLYEKVVITPHMGEASRLMKKDIPALSNNMVGMAYDFSDKHNVNIILKDSTTVILGIESLENKCNNRVYVNINGNPGMATAGSGDVLAGIVAGILAGGLTKELVEENMTKAMAMSVYIHSVAGDMAAVKLGQVSMMATDIIEMISKVLSI
jgi:NAD(P)H-hydrate epimerase